MRINRLHPRTRSRLLTLGLMLIGLSTAAEIMTPQNVPTEIDLAAEPTAVNAVVSTRSGACPNAG